MKKPPSFLIVAMALLFPACLSYGSTTSAARHDSIIYTPMIDSLVNQSNSLSGIELLRFYQNFHYVLYELNDPDVHFSLLQQLQERVKAEKYEFGEAFTYMLKTDAICNYNLPDSIMQTESLAALNFIRQIKDNPKADVYYFSIGFRLVENYLLSKNYDEALQLIEKFYAEAKEKNNSFGITAALKNMGAAYDALRSYDKAVESYREVIAIATDDNNIGIKSESYKYLIDLLMKQEQINDALDVCKEYEAFIKNDCETNPRLQTEVMGRIWFYCCLSYADIYRELGQYTLAEKYIAQAETYAPSNTALGIFGLEESRFNLLLEQGKYAEAEKSLNRINEEYGEVATFYDGLCLLTYHADLYYRWGKYDKAADNYKEYIIRNDSIKKVEMASALSSIRTQYEVDKLEMQKEQDKRFFQQTLMWLAVTIILLCAIITVVTLNARRLRTKNRALLNRIREQDELEKRNELIRSELAGKDMSSAAMEGDEGDEAGGTGDLYFRLRELMKDPAVFTDPGINRKSIAQKLGTNEKYVFNTIRRYYGMSISEYIANLRLAYARELLAHPSGKHTIETVAFEAGFGNRVTFHRLFKERNGMTPDEFRRLVANS